MPYHRRTHCWLKGWILLFQCLDSKEEARLYIIQNEVRIFCWALTYTRISRSLLPTLMFVFKTCRFDQASSTKDSAQAVQPWL